MSDTKKEQNMSIYNPWEDFEYAIATERVNQELYDREQDSLWESNRCPDCGVHGEIKGHMTCQYPED